MRTDELNFELPEELIAQAPALERDSSRLMVVERNAGRIECGLFRDLPLHLRAGDCLVLNDTRVIRARLHGTKASGGKVEIFLLAEESAGEWRALVRPSAKVKPGTGVALPGGNVAYVEEVLPGGQRRVRFETPEVLRLLEEAGIIPLPPYIHRDAPREEDAERYQTVFSARPGAVAPPTAGLHYTPELLGELRGMGVRVAFVTLHVGYGTFKPISVERLEEHSVDPEEYEVPEESAVLLNETRAAGGRVVAVGTTATRVLETCWREGGYRAGSGRTDKYIYPGYVFRGVDMLQTNFHLPQSSLLALVSAFGGTELVMRAYERAISERFRFYSYGDAMLLL